MSDENRKVKAENACRLPDYEGVLYLGEKYIRDKSMEGKSRTDYEIADNYRLSGISPVLIPLSLGYSADIAFLRGDKVLIVDRCVLTKYEMLALAINRQFEDEAHDILNLARYVWGRDDDPVFNTLFDAAFNDVCVKFAVKRW